MKPHLQPQPGLKDLAMLLDLISDPKKYKKILKELNEMHENINNSLEVKMTLEDAQTALSSSLSDAARAKEVLRDAEEKAKTLKGELLADLEKREEMLEAKDKAMLVKYDEFTKKLSKVQEALDVKEADLGALDSRLRAKSDELESKEAALIEIQATLEKKQKLMRETAANL